MSARGSPNLRLWVWSSFAELIEIRAEFRLLAKTLVLDKSLTIVEKVTQINSLLHFKLLSTFSILGASWTGM